MKANNSEPPVIDPDNAQPADDKEPESDSPTAEKLSGIMDSARQAGSKVLDQAASQANHQRQTLASGVKAIAQAFTSLGSDLSTKDEGPIAKYTAELGKSLGSQAEQLANYLKDRDLRQLLGDTQQFAHRSPTVFLGGAFVLGLAASRFLKTSGAKSSASLKAAPESASGTPDGQISLPSASMPKPHPDPAMPPGFPFDTPEQKITPVPLSAGPTSAVSNGVDLAGEDI